MAPLARRRVAVLAVAGAAALLTSACRVSINGDGDAVTETFDVADFDRVTVDAPFDTTIDVGRDRSVAVTIDEELADLVEVSVDDGLLSVTLGGGLVETSGPLELDISVPALTSLDAGAAADVTVDGLDAEAFDLTLGEAAGVRIDGEAGTVTITADGGADADLDDLTITAATLDAGGGASISLGDVDRVDGEVTGGASVDVPDSAAVSVATSGGGTVD